MRHFVKISVMSMYETCERTTFYVQLETDEGFTMTAASFATGSIYTNGEGLSIDEALDRALITAADWGDLLEIEPEPFSLMHGVVEPSMKFDRYTHRRELKERK